MKTINKMERVIIYPKDVKNITGKSDRWGREVIKKIKITYNKKDHQLVTVDEFCEYMGLSVSSIKPMMLP